MIIYLRTEKIISDWTDYMIKYKIFIIFILFLINYNLAHSQEIDCSKSPFQFLNNDFKQEVCFRTSSQSSSGYSAWFTSSYAYLFLNQETLRHGYTYTAADWSKSLDRNFILKDLDHWNNFLKAGNITFFDEDKIHRSIDKKKFYYRIFNTESYEAMRFTATFNNSNNIDGYLFHFGDKFKVNDKLVIATLDAIFLDKLRTKAKNMNNFNFNNIDTKVDEDLELLLNKLNNNDDNVNVDVEDFNEFVDYCNRTPMGDMDEAILKLCIKLNK